MARKSSRRKGCIGFVIVFLAVAIGARPIITDVLFLNFLRIRYMYDGLPLSAAWKDAAYITVQYKGSGPNLYKAYVDEMSGIMERQLLHVLPEDDHITALCKVSMYTTLVTHAHWEDERPAFGTGIHNLDVFDPGSTLDRVNSYVQACVHVYSSLDKDSPQRTILDGLTPEMRVNITTPIDMPINRDKITRAQQARYAEAAKRPSHSHLWKDTSEIPEYGFMYERTSIRPIKEETIEASEIAEAIRQGKVAKFDATKLLGKELFNLSMPEIAALHADIAEDIPMYRQAGASAPARSGIDTLKDYAHRVNVWKSQNAIRYPEHAPWRPAGFSLPQDAVDVVDGYKQPTWWLEALALLLNLWFKPLEGFYIQQMMREVRVMALQCAVNTRRLPNLPMPKIEDALGNPDWLERAWSMFWLGPVADCWHYDDPDNLLIGVYGEIWVTVFQLKDRDLMRGNMDRGCWSPFKPMPSRIDTLEAARDDKWLEKFQFVHFKLTPGTGVTVPSGAFHSLTMTDGDRILMNCFMVPKYKGLWDAPAANYSFYSNRYQTEEYHAISQLKKSSIFRLWDTRKLGGYFEGTKLEML